MIAVLLILCLYNFTVCSFLLWRFIRTYIRRKKAERKIREENLSPEKASFIASHPLTPREDALNDIKKEEEDQSIPGEVISALERELEREESDEIETSVEEREFEEEQKILRRFGR